MSTIERARKAVLEIDGTTFSGTREETREKMAQIIARHMEQGWISVSERLPEMPGRNSWKDYLGEHRCSDPVLVFIADDDEDGRRADGNVIYKATLYRSPTGDFEWAEEPEGSSLPSEPTHWQPLPDPPKEGAAK